MQTEETRALIQQYYAALSSGDRETLLSLLDDDVEWVPPQSAPFGPVRGADAVAAELGGDTPRRLFKMRTLQLTLHKTVADGDTAVVQQALAAETRDGKLYDNEYCWVYTCRDGRITRMVEYADTRKAAAIFGWD